MNSKTAQSALIGRITTVAETETDLQKLAYAAKGLESLSLQVPEDFTGSYGVSWDQSADSYTQLGSATNHTALPIQSKMRRCLVADDGTVNAYLHEATSLFLANGDTATLDGSAGQVMVEIPKFYFKHSLSGNVHSWEISEIPLSGFAVHPAFLKNGVEVDHRYIGAYEGYVSSSKLSSVSGQCPTTSQTRATFRTNASNRGAGWRQWDFYLKSAVQLLYLVEYQDFNTQEQIGNGRTGLSGGSWTCSSYMGTTGKSNGDGNGTNVDNDTTLNGTAYMTYRGIENWYGNIWKWVDGVNVNDNVFYASNNDSDFADDTSTNYTTIGTAHDANGYQGTLVDVSDAFLPDSVGASSSTKIGDYYYQSTGWRVVLSSGTANTGSYAGGFYLHAHNASSNSYAYLGGRLAF